MPRVLLVMRHAKSSWDADLPDHERPLNARGRTDAPRMALEIAERGWMPDAAVVSDAKRTMETMAWLEHTWRREVPYTSSARLYLAGLGDLLGAVGDTSDGVGTLLIVGHNPGCEELVDHLTGIPTVLTTANVARLVSPADTWAAAAQRPGGFLMEALLRPGELDGG